MAKRRDGWSLTSYIIHSEAMRVSEERFQKERDRRISELRAADDRALQIKATGDEKARQIKEQGDEKALILAREIQTYKDMIHNGILDQLKDERGQYATKDELAAAMDKIGALVSPLTTSRDQSVGGANSRNSQRNLYMVIIPGLIIAAITLIGAIIAIAYSVKVR
jgi:hypothetical protein